MITYLDIIAGALELTAIWVVGNKNKWGYIIALLCNIVWIAYVIKYHQAYGLLLVVCPAVVINIRNFKKWHKEQNEQKK